MIGFIPEFLIAVGAGKVVEHYFHDYILHQQGMNKGSFWDFHFHTHHKAAIKYGMLDPDYHEPWIYNSSRRRETLALIGGSLLVAPLLPIAPGCVAGSWYAAWNYYFKHKKAHTDPPWALQNLKNHVLHHLVDQQQYWQVSGELSDKILGTAPNLGEKEWNVVKSEVMVKYQQQKEKVNEIVKERKQKRTDYFIDKVGKVASSMAKVTSGLEKLLV